MRDRIERLELATRLTVVRAWTGAVRGVLRGAVRWSGESGRFHLEQAGVDVTALRREIA